MNNELLDNSIRENDNSLFLRENNINIVEETISNVEDCITFIERKVHNSIPIILEVGAVTFEKILNGEEGQNLVDLVLISTYWGELDNMCKGPVFPKLSKIEKYYNLVFVSQPISCNNSFIKFYTYIKKDKM